MVSFIFGFVVALLVIAIFTRKFGFMSQRPEMYTAAGNSFDICKELDGKILCEGVIYGPLGRVTSRFVADMQANWSGENGEMTEDFRYDNGNTQARKWTLSRPDADGRFTATAPDLIGTGHGRQMGSGVELNYKIKLPDSSGGHVLDATDWMYLMENGTIINRSHLRKYGIKVAELVATMRKV